ncbi:MAG TPA: long-chain-fatty-acid--CoA ligase [Blastocatellia bacterium]|nr:long-chain-fatty-acid--CoA ligase [Blastocatellia bacterium]
MLLNSTLRRAVRYFPENTATIFEGRKQNYRELWKRSRALSKALGERGVGRGDRVAIYLFNSPQFLEVVYACFEIGAVIVPLNTRLAADELVFTINDAECVALITDESLQPLATSFKSRLQGIEQYIAINASGAFSDYETMIARHTGDSAGASAAFSTDFPTDLAPTSSNSLSTAVSSDEGHPEEDLVGLFYTSGTTGLPKGVMLNHRNLWMNAMHTLTARAPEPNAVFLHAGPMFHLATFPAVINLTLNGGAHAILPKFDIKNLMEIIERDRVTSTVLVPTMINFLLNHPDIGKHDLSSLRRITYGASPMPVELLKRAVKAFPGVEFFQGYGQSESSPLLTSLMPEDHITEGPEPLMRRLASCGRPVIGVEVEVVDENERAVKPGEVGEIVARGPNVMMGYWKRPEETSQTLRGGWLRTGDMATIDEEGYIYLVDRRKDMIISGGENIYSTEVENVVYQHPAVREAAVIGVPDEKWGEAVKAIVTLKVGLSLIESELIEFCASRMADYKVPKSVEIRIGELPKSATGKILKKELREPFWQGRNRLIN